jgi:hypothetical protein
MAPGKSPGHLRADQVIGLCYERDIDSGRPSIDRWSKSQTFSSKANQNHPSELIESPHNRTEMASQRIEMAFNHAEVLRNASRESYLVLTLFLLM